MSKFKLASLLVGVAALIAISYLISSQQPARPEPANRPDANTAIAFWQGRVAQNPNSFLDYTLLAEAYTRKARETGDVSYYQRAETALRRALEINPNYVQASAALSNVLFSMHDFEGALTLAGPLADNPRATQALATFADAQLALGNYPEAEAAYQKFAALGPGPGLYSRQAIWADLHGDSEAALALMQKAADLAWQSGDYRESLAWYDFQLGELNFKSGNLKEAEAHYQAANQIFANNYLALAGLGKVRAAQSRYGEAIKLYEQAVAIIPQPDLLAALGDLYTITGQPDKARLQYDTVEFIGQLAEINQVVYNRQLALFYANHDLNVAKALELAQNEIATRKDIYGYDALAWALYKNGRYGEAAEAMEQALKLGTQDAMLYYHAGMIYEALGDHEQAQTLLKEALALNPYFDILQSRIAQATLDQLLAR
jgi:tetratricopeptide (TPR) repeat protein